MQVWKSWSFMDNKDSSHIMSYMCNVYVVWELGKKMLCYQSCQAQFANFSAPPPPGSLSPNTLILDVQHQGTKLVQIIY